MIGKVLFFASFGLLAIACRAAYPELIASWQTDEYSHGVLIPPIAALIAWHVLAREKPVVRPSWAGPAVLIVAGALLLVGELASFITVAQYAIIVALAGLCLTFLGRRAAYVLIPAFVYLIFAIPLPHLAYATLSQDLQLLSSSIGVCILDLAGVPVYQEGNIIDLGGMKLQVVEACSGLRYLFPLMSFGFLIAYLLEDRWWKRAIVFLSTIPITILTNSLRIALIGVTVDLWGQHMAEGLIHDIEGWAIFLVCIAILMAEVWILLRIDHRGRFRFDYLGPARGRLITGRVTASAPAYVTLLMAALLGAGFGGRLIDQRAEVIVSHPAFALFPLALGDWRGAEQVLEPDVLAGLQLSDYFLADYTKNDAPVNFYMAYYDTQRVGSATHSPANCIPGGGWQITAHGIGTIALPDGTPLRVSRLIIAKADVKQLVYYWFDERGRDLTETTSAKWYTMIDQLRLHRSDGALIRLVTPIDPGAPDGDADLRLSEFAGLAYPEIDRFVPGAAP